MKTQPVSKEVFDKLSWADRCVAIAQDVIDQLAIRRYVAYQGNWCTAYRGNTLYVDSCTMPNLDLKLDAELQPEIVEARCKVCAIGAVFASAVGLYDNFKVPLGAGLGRFGRGPVHTVASAYFDQVTLMAMEIAFEVGEGWSRWGLMSGFYPESSEKTEKDRENTINDLLAQISPSTVNIFETHELFDRAYKFGNDIVNTSERMIAIMQNIVDNNGEFKP